MADSRTGSAALLVNKRQQVLLQRRDSYPGIANPGKIALFGGAPEGGESPLHAIYREINEETNLNLSLDQFSFFKDYEKNGESRVVSVFLATDIDDGGMEIYEGAGIVAVDSFTDLTALPVTPLARKIVEEYFKEAYAYIGN